MSEQEDVERSAVSIPRSHVREMRTPAGRAYRILTAWPEEPPPPSGYPVIYVLDAHVMFASVVESLRMRSRRPDATGIVPAVVAGIAYPGDDASTRARRTFDYTPEKVHDGVLDETAPHRESGGASMFRDFLDREVRQAVEESLPVDPRRRTLFGHSLGGLFVLHTLLASPSSYRSYIAVSPSIWWDRAGLLGAIDSLEEDRIRLLERTRVLITVGEYEQALAPWQRAADAWTASVAQRRQERRMVDDARALAGRLEAAVGTVRLEVFAGEEHASVVLRTITEGLRFGLSE